MPTRARSRLMIQSQCWWTLLMAVLLCFGSMFPSSKVASFVVQTAAPNSIGHYQRQQRPQSQLWLSTTNQEEHDPNVLPTVIMDDDDSSSSSNSPQKYNISLLLIDHYDSFTYNLYDYLAQWTIDPPTVVAKDAFDSWNADDWKHLNLDGVILSPGPGTPEEQPPLSHQVISQNPNLPILGVCLGHQLLALEYGATVDTAPVPIHGQDHWISTFLEDGKDDTIEEQQQQQQQQQQPQPQPQPQQDNLLFQDLPNNFRVVRYHSLAAKNNANFPDCLQVTARSKGDNVIQGIQHTSNPHYGVQFHPESIGTQHGMALLENFCKIVESNKHEKEKLQEQEQEQEHVEQQDEELVQRVIPTTKEENAAHTRKSEEKDKQEQQQPPPNFQILLHAFDADNVSPQEVFEEFYANQESHAIWLDSSSRGTIDILAAPTSVDDILEYHSSSSSDNTKTGEDDDILTQLQTKLFGRSNSNQRNIPSISGPNVAMVDDDFSPCSLQFQPDSNMTKNPPFDYRGGYVGYLGYEVRHETLRFLQQKELGHPKQEQTPSSSSTPNSVPTAAFFLARQSLVYHHPTQTWYMVGLSEPQEDTTNDDNSTPENIILEWMKTTKRRIQQMARSKGKDESYSNDDAAIIQTSSSTIIQPQPTATSSPPLTFVPNRPKARYEQDIGRCHEFIRRGESYELCLTNQLEATIAKPLSPWNLYQTLRKRNPAPYSAYLQWNMNNTHPTKDHSTVSSSLAICCSSPERFMSIARQQPHPEIPRFLQAEAKPIKGTCARVIPQNGICHTDAEAREDERRARSLELSLKDRAENLMIVDLLRNDMSRVCEVGSVHVAKLMSIESFATVHQMVSTIRGTLSESATSIDLLRASFPGGSMTGAPKIRTMELLDELEDDFDRGPYAGSLGYLSVNGCMDMNIIIRSAVVTPTETGEGRNIRIGAGGAITALSETQDEYDEMLLKARAVVQAVQEWADTPTAKEEEPRNGAFAVNSDTGTLA